MQETPAGSPAGRLDSAIARATHWLLGRFQRNRAGTYWCGELEADTTLESDYILFLYLLDYTEHAPRIQKLARYIRSRQLADGSWNLHPSGPGEVSASVKAYFALKLAGHTADEPFMQRARDAILALGGIEKVNSFTKIYLSFVRQYDFEKVPVIPPEVVLLPRFFYINIYEMSYWTRAILIPLSILYAKKVHERVKTDISIRELYTHAKGVTRRDEGWISFRKLFYLADRVLKLLEKVPFKPLRARALKKAEEWICERQEQTDGLGAIFPSMVNSVLAMRVLGHPDDHPVIARTVQSLRELEIEEDGAIRLQPCVSPVWDTALAVNALREAGCPQDAPEIVDAGRWMLEKEARKPGDWHVRVPGVEPSGWYFQFANLFYPDIDDTAAVLLALDRIDPSKVPGIEAAISRGVHWMVNLQCTSGGWAAFDADVEREILTHVPYADHNAMLDPPCADITGRALEMLGRFPALRGDERVARAIQLGVEFLKARQEHDGSWYGRWGVNYIYGTWQALKGLMAVGVKPDEAYVRRAVEWLKRIQLPDGGWGETCETYVHPSLKGKGPSTAAQTAWAVMGLIAAGEIDSDAVQRGMARLLDTQMADGAWEDTEYTGTGFPTVFYLKYHFYQVYFPIFALGYYRNVQRGTHPQKLRTGVPLPRGARAARHGTVALVRS